MYKIDHVLMDRDTSLAPRLLFSVLFVVARSGNETTGMMVGVILVFDTLLVSIFCTS